MTKKSRSVKCQTKYRESEAQTDPYYPQLTVKSKEIPEVLFNNFKINNTEINIYDVQEIEKSRHRYRWESSLNRNPSISFSDKLKQLEIYEWSDFLYREKKFNEIQSDRLLEVEKMIEIRHESNKEIVKEILKNVTKRNSIETQKKKKQLQLNLPRKLRKLSCYNEKEICKFSTRNHTKLKKIQGRKYTADEIKNLCNALIPPHKDESQPTCLEQISSKCDINISTETLEAINDTEIKNLIDVQRVVKGRTIQMNLLKEKQKSLLEIQELQRNHPLKIAVDVLPKKSDEVKKNEICKKINLVIKEITEDVNDVIENFHKNQAILREAEELRNQRKNEAIKQNLLKEKQEKIRGSLLEFYNEITKEILEKIIPSIIEIIAENDAQKFLINEVRNNKSQRDDVKNLLLNLIQQVSDEKDDQLMLCALIASKDAFDEFLKNNFQEK